MKRRLRTLQTIMRVADFRIDMARAVHVDACRRHDEADAKLGQETLRVEALEQELREAAAQRRQLVPENWQYKTRELALEHERLERGRAELASLAGAVNDAYQALIARSRDHAVAEKLSDRTAEQLARVTSRRSEIEDDEQWVLLEERRR